MAITLRTLLTPPPRCEQDISSDWNDKYAWLDVFAPPWCISWDTLESRNVEPVRSQRDVVLSSLDDTRSKGVVHGGSVLGSRLSSQKPSLDSGSLHLPTPNTQDLLDQGPDATTSSDP